jgi:hypothetical protein
MLPSVLPPDIKYDEEHPGTPVGGEHSMSQSSTPASTHKRHREGIIAILARWHMILPELSAESEETEVVEAWLKAAIRFPEKVSAGRPPQGQQHLAVSDTLLWNAYRTAVKDSEHATTRANFFSVLKRLNGGAKKTVDRQAEKTMFPFLTLDDVPFFLRQPRPLIPCYNLPQMVQPADVKVDERFQCAFADGGAWCPRKVTAAVAAALEVCLPPSLVHLTPFRWIILCRLSITGTT